MATVDPARKTSKHHVRGGSVTLDGTNPTDVATGFGTIVSASVSMRNTSAPALDPVQVTTGISGETLSIYAWKATSSSNPTLIASTNSAVVVDWTAVGY